MIAHGLLAIEFVISLLFWGPIPAGALWLASRLQYWGANVGVAILVGFGAMLAVLIAGLMVLKRVDRAWILVRRAAGIDQRQGAMGRVFAITVAICARRSRSGSSSSTAPARRASPARAAERRRWRAGVSSATTSSSRGSPRTRSTPTCARPPPSAAPRGWRARAARPLAHDLARVPAPGDRQRHHLRRAPRPAPLPRPLQLELRSELAHRHGVPEERIVVGDGVAQLLARRPRALLEPRRRADHAMAVVSAVSDRGATRARPSRCR